MASKAFQMLLEYTTSLKTQLDKLLNKKVDKEEGKGLSTNDYTTEEKEKLAGLEAPTIKVVKLNGSPLEPGEDKSINIDLSTYAIKSEVTAEIAEAVSGIEKFEAQVVEELPVSGEKGILYLVASKDSDEQNLYDEYLWITDKYEQIGSSKIDLSEYAKKTEIPTSVSQLINDSGFQVASDVNMAIDSKLTAKLEEYATNVVLDYKISDLESKTDIKITEKAQEINQGIDTKLESYADKAYVDEKDEEVKRELNMNLAAYAQTTYVDEKLAKKVDKEDGKGLSTNDYTAEDKQKLAGIEAGANNYVHPENHDASMITQDATHRFVTDEEKNTWNAKPSDKAGIGLGNVTNDAQVKRSEMGVASGVATLDESGKVVASQLPSYVDDVVEVENYAALPPEGEASKIYVDKETNKTYRWSGSGYVGIVSDIALGETSSTAYAGDKGKAVTDEVNKIKEGTTIVPKAQDSATVSGHTVEINVPSNAKFTDTTYEKAEAGTKDGLMSKEDKTKLDGIVTENLALKTDVPTNTSDLVNDSNFLTNDTIEVLSEESLRSIWDKVHNPA